MKDGQKLKLGDALVTTRNIQEVQASKLGDAQGTPSSSTKISGHLSRRYIFIASYAMCCSWSVSFFVFSFVLFCFVLFAVINGWITSDLFWRETRSIFTSYNTLVFTLIVLRVFSFASTAF
jgi:hypothetical protein